MASEKLLLHTELAKRNWKIPRHQRSRSDQITHRAEIRLAVKEAVRRSAQIAEEYFERGMEYAAGKAILSQIGEGECNGK